MTAIVTGANGFIGSHLVRRLLREGLAVIAVVRPEATQWRLGDVLSRVKLVKADITSTESGKTISDSCRQAEYVFHLASEGLRVPAGYAGGESSICRTNVIGTWR